MEENNEVKKKLKLKKSVKITIVIILLLLLSPIILYNFLLSKPSNDSNTIMFDVEAGSSVYSIGTKLKKEGLIRSELAYKIYVKLNNIDGISKGVYKLKKNYNTKEILNVLTSNNYEKDNIKITFKEGKNINNIVKTISKNMNISEEEIFNVLNDEEYIDSLIDRYWFLTEDIKNDDIYYDLEGYLYPETYMFEKDASIKSIIETMLDQSNKVFMKYKDGFDSTDYSINEIVTLASIIESEGIYNDDRKNIAGVFYNRLSINMPLGSDITTYYAFKVDLGTRDLTKKEINTYNPYNTRGPKMEGKLPVGAVSNFSESSLEAALYPNENDYYYFVADNTGKTHFTKTYNEHLAIIQKLKNEGKWIEW